MGNSYASETPVSDGERIYAYFGMTGVFCYDLSGKKLWSTELGSYPMMAGWGTGASPALDDERVFIQCDNEEKSFLVALDKKTGKEVWRVKRDEKSTYCTPLIWKNSKRTELVTSGGRKVRSYEPATGKLLWEMGGMGGQASASPVAGDDLLFVGCGGRMGPKPLYAVKAGASGDITLKDGDDSNDGVAWSQSQGGPGIASPLYYKGHLYVMEQTGLTCYDATTGKAAYKRQRLAGGRSGFTSSPWAADGKLYFLDEDGTTFVIEAGPKFKLLGSNKVGEMCWSTPALADGAVFLRGVDHLFCIKK
jgi:outer membrane protein assembly factor BamB